MSRKVSNWSGNLVPLTRPDGLMLRREDQQIRVMRRERICTLTRGKPERGFSPGMETCVRHGAHV